MLTGVKSNMFLHSETSAWRVFLADGKHMSIQELFFGLVHISLSLHWNYFVSE